MDKYMHLLELIQSNTPGKRKRRIKRIKKSNDLYNGLKNLPILYYFCDIEVLLTSMNYGLVSEYIDVCYYAVIAGNVEILRWARAKNMDKIRGKPYPWDAIVYDLAIMSNNKEIIEFIKTPLFYGKCPTKYELNYNTNPKRIVNKNIRYIYQEKPQPLSSYYDYRQDSMEKEFYFDEYTDNLRLRIK